MCSRKPFIYIAALRRLGSTMLGEALTQVPHSLVFLEPRLDRGQFNIKYSQEILLENMGLNLKDFVAGINEDDNWVEKFKSQVLPLLYEKVAQVGVKEVKLNKWRQYKQIFPDMKVIVTARDPRDIYLSILERIKAGRRKWTGEFSPELIASKLNKQFAVQKKILAHNDSIKVRYEDLCTTREVFFRVKQFVESDLPDVGNVGYFLSSHPERANEYRGDGSRINQSSVFKWKRETDTHTLKEVNRISELMSSYCEYWGYDS